MIRDWLPRLISAAAVLVLAGAGLKRRKLPARRLWTLAAIWAAIVILVWTVCTIGTSASHLHFT